MRGSTKFIGSALTAVLPVTLIAFSTGPPLQRTGAAIDGGINCTACHRDNAPANSDTRGSLRLEANDYRPGVKQLIRVILSHSEAQRWGFELTVRAASDEMRSAGNLTPSEIIQVRAANSQEFATYFQSSTFLGQRNGNIWEVEWTPPATDAGEIVIHAAGNAANGNGNNAGDNIYTTSLRIKPAAPCALTGIPRISSVRNAGSMIDGPLSLNTLVTIAGAGFNAAGFERAAGPADFVDRRYPTEFGCLAVEVNGVRSPITNAAASAVGAQIPTIIDLGTVPVRVIANPGTPGELRSDPFPVTLSDTSPAFLPIMPSSNIVAVFTGTNFRIGDPASVPDASPASKGDILSLSATGLGVTDPVYQAGEIVPALTPLRDPIAIEWMGRVMDQADILYAGADPGSISGRYRIDVRVPAYARSGAQNEIRIRAGNRLSPPNATLFIAE